MPKEKSIMWTGVPVSFYDNVCLIEIGQSEIDNFYTMGEVAIKENMLFLSLETTSTSALPINLVYCMKDRPSRRQHPHNSVSSFYVFNTGKRIPNWQARKSNKDKLQNGT